MLDLVGDREELETVLELLAGDPLKLTALPIFPADKADRTTPSMSPDLCVLYYTERNGTDSNVFSAVRQ
jgi:hypothetical protein